VPDRPDEVGTALLPRPKSALTVLAVGLMALVVSVVSFVESTLWRASAASRWSVAGAIAAVGVLAVIAGFGRQAQPSRAWVSAAVGAVSQWRRARRAEVVGVVVWVVLLGAVVAWDLASFLQQSHALPTLSYLFGQVTRWPWGRGLFFAGWLGLGLVLATAARRVRASP
jgi:hypothetical protein